MMAVFLVVLFGFCVAALAWGGTLWLQGYLYNEPCDGLAWRVPTYAALMTAFVGLWCLVHVRSERGYDTLFRFSGSDYKSFDTIWVATDQQIQGGLSDTAKLGKPFERRDQRFLRDGRPWSETDAVVVEEDGSKVVFKVERDENNKYHRERGDLKYVDEKGRIMFASRIGEVSVARTGRVVGNLFLNGFQLILWFACTWLLLRYQWPHALGIAVVAWLVMTLIVLPMMFDTVAAG